MAIILDGKAVAAQVKGGVHGSGVVKGPLVCSTSSPRLNGCMPSASLAGSGLSHPKTSSPVRCSSMWVSRGFMTTRHAIGVLGRVDRIDDGIGVNALR